jgi:hypothetical protein
MRSPFARLAWTIAALEFSTFGCGNSASPGNTLLQRDADAGNRTQDAALPRETDADSAAPGGGDDAGPTTVSVPDAGGAQMDAGSMQPGSTARTYPSDRTAFNLSSPSRCAQADVLLCEDFESGAIDSSTWQVQTWGSGAAVVDSGKAARGSHSVHITEPSAVSRVMLRETRTFAQTGNHFFGRFFMLMNYAPPALDCSAGCKNLVHWTAASAGGSYQENGQTYHPDVRAIGAVNQGLLVNLDGGPKAEVGINDDQGPAGYTGFDGSHVNQWMCFEFEYSGEGDTAEVRVWWDGLEHPGLHYSTARRGDTGELWPIPKYEYLEIGLTHYQDYSSFVSSFDAWIDEIIVDDQRVGCAL